MKLEATDVVVSAISFDAATVVLLLMLLLSWCDMFNLVIVKFCNNSLTSVCRVSYHLF